MNSLPDEIQKKTSSLLRLLLRTDDVPASALDKALRLLRPIPRQGIPDYESALKARIKHSIASKSSPRNANGDTSTVLSSFEKSCEDLRRINPKLLQYALIMFEPLCFSVPQESIIFNHSHFMKENLGKMDSEIPKNVFKFPSGEQVSHATMLGAPTSNTSNSSVKNTEKQEEGTVSYRELVAANNKLTWCSEESEDKLLRDLILIFQGIDGQYIKFDSRSEEYLVDPDGLLELNSPVIGCVLELCEVGYVFTVIKNFINGKSKKQKGIVVDALCAALDDELEDYYRLLAILENELNKHVKYKIRPKDGGVDGDCESPILDMGQGAFGFNQNSGVGTGNGSINGPSLLEGIEVDGLGHSLSLLRLQVWMEEPLDRLNLLGDIVHNCFHLKGGAIPSRLYAFTLHPYAPLNEIVMRLMEASMRPVFDMLERWIYQGEIYDPYEEFFIVHRVGTTPQNIWQEGYYVNNRMLPLFFRNGFDQKVLSIGKSINFMKLCHALATAIKKERQISPGFRAQDVLSSFKPGVDTMTNTDADTMSSTLISMESAVQEDEYELTGHAAAMEKAKQSLKPHLKYGDELHLLIAISDIALDCNTRLLGLIDKDYSYHAYLHALKQFMLLGQGDFVVGLMDLMAPELRKRATQLLRHNLTGLLEGALRTSNAQFMQTDILDRVGVKLEDAKPGDIGWDIFLLDFNVDPPISAIVPESAMIKYRKAFKMLWRLKRTEWTLSASWKQLLVFSHSRGALEHCKKLKKVFHRCSLNRARMSHVVATLNTYMMFEVLESEWQALEGKLKDSVSKSLDGIVDAHDRYLDNILQRALLTTVHEPLHAQLQSMLDSIIRFCNQEDTLVADAMAALQRKRSRQQIAEQKSAGGAWSSTIDGKLSFHSINTLFLAI